MADLTPLTRGDLMATPSSGVATSSVSLSKALDTQTKMIAELEKITTEIQEIKDNQKNLVAKNNTNLAVSLAQELKKTAKEQDAITKQVRSAEQQLRNKEIQMVEKNLNEIKKGIADGFMNTWKGFQEFSTKPIGFVEDVIVNSVKNVYDGFFKIISPDKDKEQIQQMRNNITSLREEGELLLDAYHQADDKLEEELEKVGDKISNTADRIVESIEQAVDDITSNRAKEFANEFMEVAADFSMSMKEMENYGSAGDVGYYISDDNDVESIDLAAESGVELPQQEEEEKGTESLEETVSEFGKQILKNQEKGLKDGDKRDKDNKKSLEKRAKSAVSSAGSKFKGAAMAGLSAIKGALIAFVIIVFLPMLINLLAKFVAPAVGFAKVIITKIAKVLGEILGYVIQILKFIGGGIKRGWDIVTNKDGKAKEAVDEEMAAIAGTGAARSEYLAKNNMTVSELRAKATQNVKDKINAGDEKYSDISSSNLVMDYLDSQIAIPAGEKQVKEENNKLAAEAGNEMVEMRKNNSNATVGQWKSMNREGNGDESSKIHAKGIIYNQYKDSDKLSSSDVSLLDDLDTYYSVDYADALNSAQSISDVRSIVSSMKNDANGGNVSSSSGGMNEFNSSSFKEDTRNANNQANATQDGNSNSEQINNTGIVNNHFEGGNGGFKTERGSKED